MRNVFQVRVDNFLMLLVLVGLSVPCAHADQIFDWNITGAATGSGTMTAGPVCYDVYPITSMTGTFNGGAITLLNPAPATCDYGIGGGLRELGGGSTLNVTLASWLQPIFSEGGQTWQLDYFEIPESQFYNTEVVGTNQDYFVTLGIAAPPVSTPEPSAMLLLIAGLGFVFIWKKRKWMQALPHASLR